MQELVISYLVAVLLTLLLPFAFIIGMGAWLMWEVRRQDK